MTAKKAARPPITNRFIKNLGAPARRLVAEELIAKYAFSASMAVYEAIAEDYAIIDAWMQDIRRGMNPPDLDPDGTRSHGKVRAQVMAERKDMLARAERLMEFEMGKRRAQEPVEDPELDGTGPDTPEPTRDYAEWMARREQEGFGPH